MQLLLYFTWCRHGRYRCSKVDLHGTSSRVGYFPFQDLLGPRCSGALKLTLFWRFYPSVVSRHHRLFPRWVLHQKINKTVNKHMKHSCVFTKFSFYLFWQLYVKWTFSKYFKRKFHGFLFCKDDFVCVHFTVAQKHVYFRF